MLLLLAQPAAGADTIYKCIKDDKVVFSQSACPTEYKQRQMELELGLTREIDSERSDPNDPLSELMSGRAITKEKMVQLIDAEIYRLTQENSYVEILRTSERQKLNRKRFWRGEPEDDPVFIKEVADMDKRFDDIKDNNQKTIELLKARRVQVADVDTATTNP